MTLQKSWILEKIANFKINVFILIAQILLDEESLQGLELDAFFQKYAGRLHSTSWYKDSNRDQQNMYVSFLLKVRNIFSNQLLMT